MKFKAKRKKVSPAVGGETFYHVFVLNEGAYGLTFGLLSKLINSLYAPGTPAGNCLKNASEV